MYTWKAAQGRLENSELLKFTSHSVTESSIKFDPSLPELIDKYAPLAHAEARPGNDLWIDLTQGSSLIFTAQ